MTSEKQPGQEVKYPKSGAAYSAARALSGLTQEQVADLAGLSLRHYKRIERGQNRPYIGLRDRIADVLGADPSALPAAGDAPFPGGGR